MGVVGIWQWLIILALFVPYILAVRTENSGKMTGRQDFFRWLLFIFLAPLVVYFIVGIAFSDKELANLISTISHLILAFFFFQQITRRARDAGMGKTIAYLCLIPLVNIVCIVLLLFKKSAEMEPAT